MAMMTVLRAIIGSVIGAVVGFGGVLILFELFDAFPSTFYQGPDDGWALLALGRLRQGLTSAAGEALARYDELVLSREASGQPRRFPDQPEFQGMRTSP